MITVHIIIRTGALEGESSRSFRPGKSGKYRGVESYLNKVKKMYNSAVGEYQAWKGTAKHKRFGGAMSVTIVSDRSSPSLFPYTSEEITKLKAKYKVS